VADYFIRESESFAYYHSRSNCECLFSVDLLEIAGIMGGTKKWYLVKNGNAIVLHYGDSPMKLEDSEKMLGRVVDVTLPRKGKHSCDGVNVCSCNSMHAHVW